MAKSKTRAQRSRAKARKLNRVRFDHPDFSPLPQTTSGETISKTVEVVPKHQTAIPASLRRHQTIHFDERGRIIEQRTHGEQPTAPAHVVRSQWYMILRAFFFQPTLNRNEIARRRFGDAETPVRINSESWRNWNLEPV